MSGNHNVIVIPTHVVWWNQSGDNEDYEPQNFMHVGNSCAGNFFLQFLSNLPLIRLVARLSSLQRQKRQCHQCRRVLRATQKRLRSGGSPRPSPVLDRWRPLGRDTSGLLLQNTVFGGENCGERPHLAVYDTGELVIQEWKRNDNNGNSSASSNEVWGASSKQVPATMTCIKISTVLALQFIVNHTLACFPVGHLRWSQLFTRSEGGVGAAGSVLRGAGGEKENRGMRNLDGMVGSFL